MWVISGKSYTDQEAIDAGLLTRQQMKAHRALSAAAERIGANASPGQFTADRGRKHFTPSKAHLDVVTAMTDVLSGKITHEQAMALLWEYDVMKARGLLYRRTRSRPGPHG